VKQSDRRLHEILSDFRENFRKIIYSQFGKICCFLLNLFLFVKERNSLVVF
jgi:hypothetical protein